MVKLQKHKAYTYKTEKGESIEHFKHIIVVPEEAIQELGWKSGQELSLTVTNNRLIVSSSSTEANKNG